LLHAFLQALDKTWIVADKPCSSCRVAATLF
jgi:hypothetical protein